MPAVQGLDKVTAKFNKMKQIMGRNLLIKSAQEGADIVRDEAAARAPVLTGQLATNIGTAVDPNSTDELVTVVVGPAKRQFYGKFQEKGTKHQRAFPFMRPAVDSNRERIFKAMKDVVRRAIQGIQHGN